MKIVAQFKIPFIQILNEQGVIQTVNPLTKNKQALVALYRHMVLTRLFDKKAIALQRTGKIGTYPSIYGQEAVSTAVGYTLQAEDTFIPYYRDQAAQLLRGVSMVEILSYWGGDERGNDYQQSKDLPVAVPIASQCLHAAGVAFAFKYRKQSQVALVSLGEGGTSEGDFYEAMNVAGTWKLPIVFVVNNNYWAISVPLHQQTACQTIAQKAIGAGFFGIQVDGNDVIGCCHVIRKALEKARAGLGPTLIEALTYRLGDHTTADDASRYQDPEALGLAQTKEPISRLKKYLLAQNYWDDSQENALNKQYQQKIQASVEQYLAKKPQSINSIFDYHYADLPDYLVEQRAIAFEEFDRV